MAMTDEERKAKRRANKDVENAKNRARYHKNKEKEHARSKAYYEKNKDVVDAKHRAYYYEHQDENYARHWQRLRYGKECYLDLEHWKWEDVEGYDGFTVNTEVHHRREAIGYTKAQLIEQGQYYGCRADELICCTPAEHKRIHEQIDKFFKRNNYKEK